MSRGFSLQCQKQAGEDKGVGAVGDQQESFVVMDQFRLRIRMHTALGLDAGQFAQGALYRRVAADDEDVVAVAFAPDVDCLLYTSPSPRD